MKAHSREGQQSHHNVIYREMSEGIAWERADNPRARAGVHVGDLHTVLPHRIYNDVAPARDRCDFLLIFHRLINIHDFSLVFY